VDYGLLWVVWELFLMKYEKGEEMKRTSWFNLVATTVELHENGSKPRANK
jgi:hypothetical protein